MEEKLIQKTEDAIKRIVDEGLTTNNLDTLYKLTKIKHITKEDEKMYSDYGNYNGRTPGHGSYGNYGDGYGRRGYDMKYRGHDYIDRIGNDYGRYAETRGRYGANEETDKAHHYMVKSLEDFIKFLYEDAETPQQKQMISEALQRSIR